jgi:hypothetical protein
VCDASDLAVGAVKDKAESSIYYASEAQPTTEKVVFAFDKFRSYLVGAKVIVYTDHAAIRDFSAKKDAKPISI